MRPYNLSVRRLFLAALLIPALAWTSLRAEDEPLRPQPVAPEAVLLGRVVSDPGGEATRLAREVGAALAAEDHERSYERILALVERHGDVLLPLDLFGARRFGRTDGALRWPVRKAANLALAQLPEGFVARAEEHWSARITALRQGVARGEESALVALADDFGATSAGAAALLVLGQRDLERGRLTQAARCFERWLELNPLAPVETRADVAVRLADALSELQDAGALDALAALMHELREVPVSAAGEETTLAERIAAYRSRDPEPPASVAPGENLSALEEPVLLWSRSLEDPGYLRQGGSPAGLGVTAGAWADEEAVVLHEGRIVRRLDAATGLERWRFPQRQPVTIHAPSERYHGHDQPWRSVTPAGDAVLVVLGDPAASGRYLFLEEEFEADQLGQECRLRLACLDAATGALRWHTGAIDEQHPVLGHRATGCASPPLVVGNDVYCLFARRIGATTFFLARLDLATGKPLWVAPLAAGESGRGDDQSLGLDRFTSPYAQSIPFGARPALAGGEICAVPHAGFAAGVDARVGAVRWVRALPRYLLNVVLPVSEGHNLRNAPLAWGDAWIIAAMDSPRLVCVARGSGDLRWQRGETTPADPPEWRDLLGIAADERGRPRLRLSGWRPYLMNPANGALTGSEDIPQWETTDGPGGAALDTGRHVVRLAAGGLQIRAWDASAVGEHLDVQLPSRHAPEAGDLVRAGRVWILIGRKRVAAYAASSDVFGDKAALAAPGGKRAARADAARHAAELALRARLASDAAWLEAAAQAAHAIEDAALRAGAQALIAREARALVEVLADEDGELAELRRVAAVVRGLPPELQGDALREVSERFFEIDAKTDGAELLVHWIDTATDDLVAIDDVASSWLAGNRVRGDLLAARRLRSAADDAAVRVVLEKRETRYAAALAVVMASQDPARIRAALRRGTGTRAAHALRRVLLDRAAKAGRFDEAAALAADLRLDPPWLGTGVDPEQRLREAALLQMQEARSLAAVGEGQRARELAYDLERWAPGGLRDGQGRTQTDLRDELRARFGWFPLRTPPKRLDVWRGLGGPEDRDETRSVEFLTVKGPGAGLLDPYVLLVRGLTVEVWSRAEGRRLAALHGPDEGWFGGSLSSVDSWVPGGGILVSSLVAGEPADRSGVRDGDWVQTWDGKPVRDLSGFMQLVASSEPGRKLPVGIWRGGRRVLAQFTAGRRPAGQGRLVKQTPLWADAAGRVLVPGRTGLSWIDPKSRSRRPHWRWTEPGVVRRCDVIGGRACVLINRGLEPDLVVAVDLQKGRELWRTEVRGRVTWMEGVGSALWIHTLSPASALVVDLGDGTPRGHFRTFDRHRGEFRKNWEPDREADVACGRGFLVSGDDNVHVLRILNTTTCAIEHTDAWEYQRARGVREYVNPQVSAGPFVSVNRGGRVRLYFPDPLGGAPRHVLDLSDKDVISNQSQFGAMDRDARLYVCGRTLYVVRVPLRGRRNVNIGVFGVDYEALGRRDPTDRAGGGSVVHMRTSTRMMGGPTQPRRYVLNLRARCEGLLVSAAILTDEHRAETWWVASMDEDGDAENVRARLLEQPMSDARRHPPVKSGAGLFVPTDEGALVYEIRREAAASKDR